MSRRGFTLLEMLVATAIMGIAIVGLLSNISASLRNASRLTEYDRASVLAREKMSELLLDTHMPRQAPIEGTFDPAITGGSAMGWRARLTPFEVPPRATTGTAILERLELQVWWGEAGSRRTLALDSYRRSVFDEAGPGR